MNFIDKILLEAKNEYLFHATPSKNYQNIKKNGLQLGFDGRIYLANSFGAACDIAQQLADTYKEDDVVFYSILKVNITGIKLNVDEDYNSGFFITTAIPPQKIKRFDVIKVIKWNI